MLGCGFGETIIVHLAFADHLHQFDAGQMMRAHRNSLMPIIDLMMRLIARRARATFACSKGQFA